MSRYFASRMPYPVSSTAAKSAIATASDAPFCHLRAPLGMVILKYSNIIITIIAPKSRLYHSTPPRSAATIIIMKRSPLMLLTITAFILPSHYWRALQALLPL